jgi:hypothetical protein
VLLNAWLFGVTARWDVDQVLGEAGPDKFSMESGALGVVVGHRSRFESLDVDIAAGPTIVTENQEIEESTPELAGDGTDVRLSALLRVSFPTASAARFFVASDLEASPARIRHSKYLHPGLPSAPSWSAGLSAGVLWEAL